MPKSELLTIREIREKLDAIEAESPFGDETTCYFCVEGMEYYPITDATIDPFGPDVDREQEGSVVLFLSTRHAS